MVEPPQYQSVELRLAEAGQELAAAIEAAQFARLVDHDPPADPAEAAPVQAFVELFAGAAERWDQLGPVERSGLLAGLGEQLEVLERRGWFVHWATVSCGVARQGGEAVPLPLAIVRVGRSAQPTVRARIPKSVGVEPGSGALH